MSARIVKRISGAVELTLLALPADGDSEEPLRQVLGERLGVAPAELTFRRDERGKPRLDGTDVAFNLSHSGGMLLIGVADGGEIGVDLERIRPRRLDRLARKVLTDAERESFDRAGEEASQTRWLLRRWTAKEAVAKALGAGLALAPSRIEIEATGEDRAQAEVAPADGAPLPHGAGPIEVRWLEPAEGFVAAVAALP